MFLNPLKWVMISSLVSISFLSTPYALAQTPPQQAELLGIKLTEADMQSVRTHLANLGGFKQDRATADHRNMDKFFAYSNLRDSYYVQFRYDANGKVVSAKRLLRRSGTHFNNDYRDVETQQVARQLIQTYGQPNQVIRKSLNGLPSYASFVWQDDQVRITVDRVGSDRYAPIFIEYEVTTDPYVAKQEENENQNPINNVL
ncbi:MAG: hypothetical protein IBX48_02565 [Thiomicrospira sp.]|uniref:hypothetical protein n=1 Tax=Thiomicrospira sp. TaxID=935 RepID=UPI0019E915ED|nr:hypothetical protein [Thiomicrospira sp.]MBE0493200.1 hypothetical protein [Thiomicrospira sp.]